MLIDKICAGAKEVLTREDLLDRMELKKIKGLNVKLGFDPTNSDLHLGHMITINAAKRFQEAGHNLKIIVGDFTATIGDPSGRSKARSPMSKEQVLFNAKKYIDQISRFIDVEKSEILHNSAWLAKMGLHDIFSATSNVTIHKLLSASHFKSRFSKNSPIGINELMYPILQGWDSYKVKADVELGGIDQKFNILSGRSLQSSMGELPQCAVLYPVLQGVGTDEKMSKSLHNFISINENVRVMFDSVMSIKDDQVNHYFEVLLPEISLDKISTMSILEKKRHLAELVVRMVRPKDNFDLKESYPIELKMQDGDTFPDLLLRNNIVKSKSQARQRMSDGALRIKGVIVSDFNLKVDTGVHFVFSKKLYKVK